MYFLQVLSSRRVGYLETKDYTPSDRPADDDGYVHAPGKICEKCDRMIEVGQPARRHGKCGWVHDLCPVIDE